MSAIYGYENDNLRSIHTESTNYSFLYGNFSLRTQVSAGNHILANYAYTGRNNYLDTLAYGNDDVVKYDYDEKGRIIETKYGYIEQTQSSETDNTVFTDSITYAYDSEGALAQVKSEAAGITLKYFYDLTERVARYTETGEGFSNAVSYSYDVKGNLTELAQKINGTDRVSAYTYDSDNRPISQTVGNDQKTYSYDALGRLQSTGVSYYTDVFLETNYTYKTNASGNATTQVERMDIDSATDDLSYAYTYDKNGNIKSVTSDGFTTTYTYDSANQLIRVDAPGSDAIFLYTYDDAGNLTSSARCPWTDSDDPTEHGYDEYALYEYNDPNGWGDLLTKYAGNTITYDEIGNPDAIRGWSMEWEHGRQLASMSKGSTEWSFTYNADGLRTKRTNGTKTYTYSYINNQLWYYKVNDQEVFITWDANGLPFSMTTGNSTYYYVTNLQGDVTALMNDAGVIVASYTYTPWGAEDWINPTSGTIAHLNPLRYRGYVFDEETKLYYLQSRYYDPEIGRFINADGYTSTGQGVLGNNMFAYCGNNPVNNYDPSGNRYCAAATISDESFLDRGHSCAHQTQIARENANVHCAKVKPNMTPNPNHRHGHERRQPGGNRERNVGHPNGEEHSRIPKGNRGNRGVHRMTCLVSAAAAAVGVIWIVGNDFTGIGVTDDGVLLPTVSVLWESISRLFQ